MLLGLYVIELLRRKKLNEEYCLWWLCIIVATIVLVLDQPLLIWITHRVGALVPVSTLTMFSLVLIIGMLVYFSMKISVFSNQVKELVQHTAITEKMLDDKIEETKMSTEALKTDKAGKP